MSHKKHNPPPTPAQLALDGLRQIAFGKCNDAVKLALLGEDPRPEAVDRLNLHCISELKLNRGAKDQLEIKFHDRIRAMEILLEWDRARGSGEGGNTLATALERSAAALGSGDTGHGP